jgi:CRISPR-associated protein Csm1
MQEKEINIFLQSLAQDLQRLKPEFHFPNISSFKKNETDVKLLQKAAELAIGKKEQNFEKTNFTKTQNIFSRLKINDVPLPNRTQSEQSNHKIAFQNFEAELKNIQNLEKLAYAETVLALTEKHFSDISCGCESDIPFSVFAKIKAAFAVCLAQNNEKTEFLLVGGDISGIQGYIYDISSKNASKSLKGRSFYLQMLVNSLVVRTLAELNLPYCNVIYDSGGKFYLLAPDLEKNQTALQKLQKEFEEKIFDEHGADLYFSLAFVPFCENTLLDNSGEGLSIAWGTLNEKFTLQKRQKYKNLMLNNFDKFFADKGIEGSDTQLRDPVTGAEISENDFVWIEKDDNKGEFFRKKAKDVHGKIFFKKTSAEPVYAGKILKSVTHIASVFNDKNSPWYAQKDIYVFNPCKLNVHHLLIEKTTDASKFIDLTKKENRHGRISRINEDDFFFHSDKHKNFTFRTERYGGNDYPFVSVIKDRKAKDLPKTFSEMAGMQEDDRSYSTDFQELKFKRYAVLRMDVDNLGSIFQKSLSGDVNFARYATLSRSLDVFFKGKLNQIWEQGFSESTQIIYAGGDDLFIVGRWDKIIEFAEKIRSEFRTYVGRNDIGISAGIAVVSPKFPIAKAAEMAGEAEKEAKKHPEKEKREEKKLQWQKDSVSFFGKPLHWEHEFPLVKELKDFILYIYEDAKPILWKLRGYYDVKQRINDDKERVKNGEKARLESHTESWRWQLAYQIARTQHRYSKNKSLNDFLEDVKIGVFTGRDRNNKMKNSSWEYFDLLVIAAVWAEFEFRTNKK